MGNVSARRGGQELMRAFSIGRYVSDRLCGNTRCIDELPRQSSDGVETIHQATYMRKDFLIERNTFISALMVGTESVQKPY